MAFKHGKGGYFALDDSGGNARVMSPFVRSVDLQPSSDLPDTTFYGSTAVRKTVVGLKDNSFSVEFYHDTTANTGSWTVLPPLLGAANASTFTWGPEGVTTGLPRVTGECRLASLSMGSQVDGVIMITANFVSDDAVTFDTMP